ncbi:hypothetical protein MP228_012160 [Amoeboaphelidium protococcarum]|nr:hypothetical protein MP228_012160 [Amoeboaphelidium protococcarum]
MHTVQDQNSLIPQQLANNMRMPKFDKTPFERSRFPLVDSLGYILYDGHDQIQKADTLLAGGLPPSQDISQTSLSVIDVPKWREMLDQSMMQINDDSSCRTMEYNVTIRPYFQYLKVTLKFIQQVVSANDIQSQTNFKREGSRDGWYAFMYCINDVSQETVAVERLERFSSCTQNLMTERDIVNDMLWINHTCAQIRGYPQFGEYKFPGLDNLIEDSIHPEDMDRMKQEAHADEDSGAEFYSYKYRVITASGAILHYMSQGRYFFDADGQRTHATGLVFDVTSMENMRAAIRKSEQNLRNILDNLPVAVYEVDGEKRLHFGNQRLEQMTEFSLDELLGDGYNLHLYPQDGSAEESRELFKEKIQQGKIFKRRVQMRTKSGKVIPVLSKSLLKPIANGHYLGIVLDISDIAAYEEQLEEKNRHLQRALEQAESSNKARSLFFASVSHEIRTPLNGIIGNLDLLAQSGVSEAQKECFDTIVECGGYLVQLINDVLELSKIESQFDNYGSLTLRESCFNVQQTFQSVVWMFKSIVNQKGIVLSLEFVNNLPQDQKFCNDGGTASIDSDGDDAVSSGDENCACSKSNITKVDVGASDISFNNSDKVANNNKVFVVTDESRLRQVVVNLLSNAIKFTSSGAVRVKVTMDEAKEQDLEAYLTVEVSDTGCGISLEDQQKLFQPFSQIMMQRSESEDLPAKFQHGAGLGLAISQKFVEALGGKIQIQSEVGHGSKFFFTLPVELGESGSTRSVSDVSLVGRQQIEFLRILVVEDNPVNMKVALKILERMGCVADKVTSGEAAVKAILEQKYDLVFLDITLPDIDGVEVVRRIRQKMMDTYIVAFTANCMSGDREVYLKAGMNDYCSKPARTEDFNMVLSKFASRRGKMSNFSG